MAEDNSADSQGSKIRAIMEPPVIKLSCARLQGITNETKDPRLPSFTAC